MTVQEERVLGVLEVVQLEAWRDTFLLVLVQKAQWRALHLAGVPEAVQAEHWGYSKGQSPASLETGRLLYCSQTFWPRTVQVAHLPTKIHLTFFRRDPSATRGAVTATRAQGRAAERAGRTQAADSRLA